MFVLIASLLLTQAPAKAPAKNGVQVIRPKAKGSVAPTNNHGIKRVDCKADPTACGLAPRNADGETDAKIIMIPQEPTATEVKVNQRDEAEKAKKDEEERAKKEEEEAAAEKRKKAHAATEQHGQQLNLEFGGNADALSGN